MILVPLTRGLSAKIDNSDATAITRHKWYAMKAKHTFYATRKQWMGDGKSITIYMHRQLTSAQAGEITDHRNGDGLDNQRCNLRKCGQSQNNANQRRVSSSNSSGIKGVSFHGARNKWRAHIQVNGKFRHLGLFATKEAAANAYREASEKFFGEFSATARASVTRYQ